MSDCSQADDVRPFDTVVDAVTDRLDNEEAATGRTGQLFLKSMLTERSTTGGIATLCSDFSDEQKDRFVTFYSLAFNVPKSEVTAAMCTELLRKARAAHLEPSSGQMGCSASFRHRRTSACSVVQAGCTTAKPPPRSFLPSAAC